MATNHKTTAVDSGSQAHRPGVMGLHLTGANAPRTAAVILQPHGEGQPAQVAAVYEKIGSFGRFFADDRILTIVKNHTLTPQLFVDVPLTLPPCGMCVRPVCPGILECQDHAVAYMLKLNNLTSKRRKRPLNPQSQRLWDTQASLETRFQGLESPYNSSRSALYIRLQALQKRLQSLTQPMTLKETSIPHSLMILAQEVGFPLKSCRHYRNFSDGAIHRDALLQALVEQNWLTPPTQRLLLKTSLDAFNALICAIINLLYSQARVTEPHDHVYAQQGWVYLPALTPHTTAATRPHATQHL